MIEKGAVLVDTNVLLDVIEEDQVWVNWSMEQMRQYPDSLFINPMIFTELCYHSNSPDEVERTMLILGLHYREFTKQALYLTSQAFKTYRSRGGMKNAPLPDFFIGAHAMSLNVPLLTRDTERYRSYFPEVDLICPKGKTA